MPKNWWYCSAFDGQDKLIIESDDDTDEQIQDIKAKVHRAFGAGKFSYFFYRTYQNHFPDCGCLECETIRAMFQSAEFISFLSELCGQRFKKNNEIFISRYDAGSFLTVHNDNGNGKVAFVLGMTCDWLPQYGGNLHILNNSRTSIRKIIIPQFNTLTVFHIPEIGGIPHFVSHVSPEVTASRYAITGWYS